MTICRLHKEMDDTIGCTCCQEHCRFLPESTTGTGAAVCHEQECGDECDICYMEVVVDLADLEPCGEA